MRWGDYPAVPESAQWDYKGPIERVAGGSRSVVGDTRTKARGWSELRKGP